MRRRGSREGPVIAPAATRVRRAFAPIVAAVLAVGLLAGIAPARVAATTPDETAARVLDRINADRRDRGLVVYRAWDALAALAADRAQRMADQGSLSHGAAGGNVGEALDARGIDWLGYGEIIGKSGWPMGREAADNLYAMWKDSDVHRGLMFSATYNYAGVGVALSPDGSVYASVVMTESLDHTAPVAKVVSLTRSGDDLTFTWGGRDPRLQTHTAGLRSYDVQFRRDDRAWKTIRDDTTSTRLRKRDRAGGHWYRFRVQAADRRGTLSAWTVEARIWVP